MTIVVEFISFADHMHTRRVPRFVVVLDSHLFRHPFCLFCWPSKRRLTMALVDFHQLVALYKPRRGDAGFPSIHSHPLMSATPPPHSFPQSGGPDEVRSIFPPIPPEPRTPQRPRHTSYALPGSTPLARGSAARKNQEGNTDRTEKFTRADYDEHIREDLGSRVFVDFEVFLKNVLHVPDDWRDQWKSAIDAVKEDQNFIKHHNDYCNRCNDFNSVERAFYEPLIETANAVLAVVTDSNNKFDNISSNVPQRYHVNDPDKLRGGIFNKAHLSPDVIALHESCGRAEGEELHWANPLHVLEVKPFDNALCDGTTIPRLVVDGEHLKISFWVWT